jgi:hypothetical protein
MAYEKFGSKSTRKNGPTATLRPDGRIRLNSDATLKFRGLGATRVYLLWDKQRERIALQVASEDSDSSYKLTFSEAQNSTDIGAKAFIKHIGLTLNTKLDMPLEWNQKAKMFEGKLPGL